MEGSTVITLGITSNTGITSIWSVFTEACFGLGFFVIVFNDYDRLRLVS